MRRRGVSLPEVGVTLAPAARPPAAAPTFVMVTDTYPLSDSQAPPTKSKAVADPLFGTGLAASASTRT